MKIVKILLSITTILCALLGLQRLISFDITQPLMMLSLATLLLLMGIEYRRNRDNLNFILSLVVAIFLYNVTLYIVIWG